MELQVNGVSRSIKTLEDTSLLQALREELDLTGSKYGCGEGQCGACTVLLNGVAVRSCRIPVKSAENKQVITIEGLEQNGKLHPVQEAFLKVDVFQCGYCAPGMIMSAVGLLQQNANPTEEQIIGAMNGNICRCGTYPRIVRAIQEAAKA
ncbi:(2Fe-2S)-binding protein [Pontibacter sp. 13R65]|uniref:(2Fe-2S)-binding protein n=1 Tax=Pontibacter sp. 13R65 TaxID=3127458 RepID=UPI00301E22BA